MTLHKRSLMITQEWLSDPTQEQWDELRALEEDPRMTWDDIKHCMLVAEAEVSKRLLDQTGRHANPHELILRRDPEKNVAMAYREKHLTVKVMIY